jgi:hypothetical protein
MPRRRGALDPQAKPEIEDVLSHPLIPLGTQEPVSQAQEKPGLRKKWSYRWLFVPSLVQQKSDMFFFVGDHDVVEFVAIYRIFGDDVRGREQQCRHISSATF